MSVSINGTNGITFNNGSTEDVGSVGTGTQTWQDVTSSRASGTTYTNSTGKPIQIVVACTATGGIAYINGSVIINTGTNAGMSYIVPNGNTYKVTANTAINSWWELR